MEYSERMKTNQDYIAKKFKNKWYVYNMSTQNCSLSCADKNEAERYALKYNEKYCK